MYTRVYAFMYVKIRWNLFDEAQNWKINFFLHNIKRNICESCVIRIRKCLFLRLGLMIESAIMILLGIFILPSYHRHHHHRLISPALFTLVNHFVGESSSNREKNLRSYKLFNSIVKCETCSALVHIYSTSKQGSIANVTFIWNIFIMKYVVRIFLPLFFADAPVCFLQNGCMCVGCMSEIRKHLPPALHYQPCTKLTYSRPQLDREKIKTKIVTHWNEEKSL